MDQEHRPGAGTWPDWTVGRLPTRPPGKELNLLGPSSTPGVQGPAVTPNLEGQVLLLLQHNNRPSGHLKLIAYLCRICVLTGREGRGRHADLLPPHQELLPSAPHAPYSTWSKIKLLQNCRPTSKTSLHILNQCSGLLLQLGEMNATKNFPIYLW